MTKEDIFSPYAQVATAYLWEDHMYTFSSKPGRFIQTKGRWKAMVLYEEVLAGRQHLLGSEHGHFLV